MANRYEAEARIRKASRLVDTTIRIFGSAKNAKEHVIDWTDKDWRTFAQLCSVREPSAATLESVRQQLDDRVQTDHNHKVEDVSDPTRA